ncbi:MAG: hypothetical protein IPF99_07150 [Deltaproteobacteria bacterium]|nr:hypothetical protein [Deltaproteobacteria bacterium]
MIAITARRENALNPRVSAVFGGFGWQYMNDMVWLEELILEMDVEIRTVDVLTRPFDVWSSEAVHFFFGQ